MTDPNPPTPPAPKHMPFGKVFRDEDGDLNIHFMNGRWDGATLVLKNWSGPVPTVYLNDVTGDVSDATTHKIIGQVK